MNAHAKKPAGFATGLSISDRRTPAADQDVETITHSQQGSSTKNPPKEAPFSWIWKGEEYVSIPEGAYDAHCVKWIPAKWVRHWGRYSLNLKFWILAESVELTMFVNFAENKKTPGLQSKFFKSWTLVNGDFPRRGEVMSADIFVDPSLLYTVRVVNADIDSEGKAKPECSIYSKVSEILKVRRP
jgi:hypothetical protein